MQHTTQPQAVRAFAVTVSLRPGERVRHVGLYASSCMAIDAMLAAYPQACRIAARRLS